MTATPKKIRIVEERDDYLKANEEEDRYASMLQRQISQHWRSNLLPRSRLLELCVFKKMLSNGLHLYIRTLSPDVCMCLNGSEAASSSSPYSHITIFANATFDEIWWYNPVGPGYTTVTLRDIVKIQNAEDPTSGSARTELERFARVDDDDLPTTFIVYIRSDIHRAAAEKATSKSSLTKMFSSVDEDNIALTSMQKQTRTPKDSWDHCFVFSCDNEELYHFVVDGFEMIVDQGVLSRNSTDSIITTSHKRLSFFSRCMLSFHQLYRPEHHPNHPKPVMRNGIEVQVLYSSEYIVEFNGQLIRLPNPFFAPGMYVNGKITSYDPDGESYTVLYLDGPYEHDETPEEKKKNFPEGTIFSFVKVSNIIVDNRSLYTSEFPYTIVLMTLIQFIISVGLHASGSQPASIMAMQVGKMSHDCRDLRPEVWRLWTYQLLPSSWPHLIFNFIVQIVYGLPINLVHGSLRLFLLYQIAIPVAALTVGFAIPNKMISTGLVSTIGGVYAILGVHIGNLIINFNEAKDHGLINRWARLGLLMGIIAIETIILSVDPDSHTSPAMHAGGLITGILLGVAIFANLNMTHFERTWVIPAGRWLISFYIVFCLGWFIPFFPPQQIFPGFAFLDADLDDPCCLKLLDCNIKYKDVDLFGCEDGTIVTNIPGATAIVKAQTCFAFKQYAALQIVAASANSTSS